MKKLILFCCALLSFATILSSCTEDDSTEGTNTTPSAVAFTVTDIVSYVGQSNAQISSSITAKGYALTNTDDQGDGVITYSYTSSTTGSACMILEYNNVVAFASYVYVSLSSDEASKLSPFIALSNQAYSFYSTREHDYGSTILTTEPQVFTSHQSLINAINSSTGILTCMESFNVMGEDEESLGSMTQLMYLSSDMVQSKGFASTSITHTDYDLMPGLEFKN